MALIIQFVLFIKQDHYFTVIFHSEMAWAEALDYLPDQRKNKYNKNWEDTSNFGHFLYWTL